MTAYFDRVWRYRKVICLPDGSRLRISGTPPVNSRQAAEAYEESHVERVRKAAKESLEDGWAIERVETRWVMTPHVTWILWTWSDGYTRTEYALLRDAEIAGYAFKNGPVESNGSSATRAVSIAVTADAVARDENVAARVARHAERMRTRFPGIRVTKSSALRSLIMKGLKTEGL